MSTITISEKATATAKGRLNNKHCKPVLCIDTGEIFSSVFDAAEHYNANYSCISMACNGKLKTAKGMRFCFISRTSENIDAIVSRIKASADIFEKAAAYDAMIAEQEAKANAIAAAEREIAEQERLYVGYMEMASEARRKRDEAKLRLASLNGNTELREEECG